jgi:hypothetical protein
MPNPEQYANLSVNKERSEKLRADFKRLGLPGSFVSFALDSTEQNIRTLTLIKKIFPNHEITRNNEEIILLDRKNNTFLPLTNLFFDFLKNYKA